MKFRYPILIDPIMKPRWRMAIFGVLWVSWSMPIEAETQLISWNALRQTIDGFGVSEAFHQARHIMEYPEPARTEILDLLFSPSKGAGVSILRNIVGDGGTWGNAMDGPTPTIEPEEGVWNWTGDEDQIWLMRQALSYGCTSFLSTVWSPPAWMKTSAIVEGGGSLRADKYPAYAHYLSRYVSEYQRRYGLTIAAISLQNEPDLVTQYSSCKWTGPEFREFIRNHLVHAFKQDGITAKVVVGDTTNFGESPAVEVLGDAIAADRLDIVSTHSYDAKPEGHAHALPISKQHGKRVWMTEVSSFEKNDPSIKDGIRWAKLIHEQLTVSEVNAWFYWWGACYKDNRESLITLDVKNHRYSTNQRLFTFANFSRFIRPGDVRIECAPSPTPGVFVSAFSSAVGDRMVLVAINASDSSREIDYALAGCKVASFLPFRTSATENLVNLAPIGSLKFSLPAQSVTSFVAEQVLSDAITH